MTTKQRIRGIYATRLRSLLLFCFGCACISICIFTRKLLMKDTSRHQHQRTNVLGLSSLWDWSDQQETAIFAPKDNATIEWPLDATGLPDCGRNKLCLEGPFVEYAEARARRTDEELWEYLLTPTMSYPYNYTTTQKTCDVNKHNTIVFYVISHPANTHRRQLIRNSWGSYPTLRGLEIVVLFGLGIPDGDSTLQGIIDSERELYGDIIQGNFQDSYRNLTLKTRMGFQWMYGNCAQGDYFVKMDDDVFVNIFLFVDMILDGASEFGRSTILCTYNRDIGPIRSVTDRFYTSETEYKFDYYPTTFCTGRAFVVPVEMALRIYVLTSRVRFLWLEDVWATGILGSLAGASLYEIGYKILDEYSFSHDTQPGCFFDVPPRLNVSHLLSHSWSLLHHHQRSNRTTSTDKHCMCSKPSSSFVVNLIQWIFNL